MPNLEGMVFIMVRKLLRRKAWIICYLAIMLVGFMYLASVYSMKEQVKSEWQRWKNKYEQDKARYEQLIEINATKEGDNKQKEEQIRAIWTAVSTWGTVTYEESTEVGAGSEYAKCVLAEMLDDLASSLASTPSNRGKIQLCEKFIDEIESSIGTKGVGQNAIKYAEYLIRVFKERK